MSVISSHSFSPIDINSPNFSAWDKFAFPFTVGKTRLRRNCLLVFFIISRQILGLDSYSSTSLLTLTYTHTPYIHTYICNIYVGSAYIRTYIYTYLRTWIHMYVRTNIHVSVRYSMYPKLGSVAMCYEMSHEITNIRCKLL